MTYDQERDRMISNPEGEWEFAPSSQPMVEEAKTMLPDADAPATEPAFRGELGEALDALLKMTRRVDEGFKELEETISLANQVAPATTLNAASSCARMRRLLDALGGTRLILERTMGPKEHCLKADPGPFDLVVRGLKTYEVRTFDRDFRAGDFLVLSEFDRETGRYSGRKIRVRIATITAPGTYGLPPGVGVLGIEQTR